jgi:hypothetical protein
LASTSREEVSMKLPYFVDVSLYSEFKISSIERLKPNFHLLHKSVLEPEADEAAKRAERFEQGQLEAPAKIEQPTNQPSDHLWAFGLVGKLVGKSERVVLSRLSTFLARAAGGSNISLPFVSDGHFILECEGPVDSTRRANLDKNSPDLFSRRAHIVGGGGCSPR